jgi:hypothetical protein
MNRSYDECGNKMTRSLAVLGMTTLCVVTFD